MRFLVRLSLLLLLSGATLLQAYDINATLIEGDAGVYEKFLKKIDKKDTNSSESELERSLLHILIKLENKTPNIADINETYPSDTLSYRVLFGKYLETVADLGRAQKALSRNRRKIETIEDEIQKLAGNSSKALSLELQDAIYHKTAHLQQKEAGLYKALITKTEKVLINSLEHINIDTETIKKEIAKNRIEQEKISNKIDSLRIYKEQDELASHPKAASILESSVAQLETERQSMIKESVVSRFLLFAAYLQRRDKYAFTAEKQLLQDAGELKDISSGSLNRLTMLLQSMEKRYIGAFQTLAGTWQEELKSLWYQAWELINDPIFTINKTPISILKLIVTLFIFAAGLIIGVLYKRKIKNMQLNRRSFTPSTRTLMANMGYYLIIIIAFFISLNVLGIKLSSLAFIVGALSVGIGFGLQNVVSNFVSGLILMFERSIKIGDFIEVDEKLSGYVSDIRMRSTTVVTNDNIDVIIPNQKLIENNVINWTMNDTIRRFSVPFDVAYGTDAHKVIKIVTEAVLNSEFREDIVNTEHHRTSVIMTGMGDSSVNFELLVWVRGDRMRKPRRTASIFLLIIYDVLNKNGIEIPFPQRDIHIRSVEGAFVVKEGEKGGGQLSS